METDQVEHAWLVNVLPFDDERGYRITLPHHLPRILIYLAYEGLYPSRVDLIPNDESCDISCCRQLAHVNFRSSIAE
jgi:hypothetical protein